MKNKGTLKAARSVTALHLSKDQKVGRDIALKPTEGDAQAQAPQDLGGVGRCDDPRLDGARAATTWSPVPTRAGR